MAVPVAGPRQPHESGHHNTYAQRVRSNGLITGAPLDQPAITPSRAWPNPSAREVSIGFSLPMAMTVRLEVFDVVGRRVWASASRVLEAGYHTLSWGGQSDAGATVGGGIYFLRVRGAGYEVSRAVMRVR